MICIACKREFQPNVTEYIVCPYCGASNTSSPPNTTAIEPLAIQPNRGLAKLFSKKPALIAIGVFTALLLISGAVFAVLKTREQNQTSVTPSSNTAATTEDPLNTQKPEEPEKEKSVTVKTATNTKPKSGLSKIISKINKQLLPYGVTVTLKPQNNEYTYSTWSVLKDKDLDKLQQVSTYLTEEFNKYPTDLVANSGLSTIGLVKNLKVSDQGRAAAAAPSIEAMLYDVNAMVDAGSTYAREVVSHEYWHYLDYQMQGSYDYDDSKWKACNPGGFKYGAGGVYAYEPESGYVAEFYPKAGFITTYSTYGIEEDRAEMFGWLIYKPSKVKDLNDSKINCKIKRLTTLIHQLSPSMTF